MTEELRKVIEASNYIKSIIPSCSIAKPQVGIVCGSGLGNLSHVLENIKTISYATIPHFVTSTVVGHSGQYVFGKKNGVDVVCMKGRVHLYEGYTVSDTIRPIRVMALLGIKYLIVTNAAGGLNKCFNVGDFMIIKDHISFPSLCGENPLRGEHHNAFGERFVPMTNLYDKGLIKTLKQVSNSLGINGELKEGVYTMVSGPTYETVAEARLMKVLGTDAVGMSTVHEVTTAQQMGIKCLGISLITNKVQLDYNDDDNNNDHINGFVKDNNVNNSNSLRKENRKVNIEAVGHEEVIEMSKKRAAVFIKLVTGFIEELKHNLDDGAIGDNHLFRNANNIVLTNGIKKVNGHDINGKNIIHY